MSLFLDAGYLILGFVLLYYGAEWLVKGASEIAFRLGISALVVSLTVVAFGTSAPELLVSLSANLEDPPKGDMALGNIVGSNICNIALILGAGALVRPIVIHTQIIRREMPILLIISVGFALFLLDGGIARWEGAVLFAGILLYVWASIRQAKREPSHRQFEESAEEGIRAVTEQGGKRILFDLLLVGGGLGVLIVGAKLLVLGGSNIARDFGVSEAVIGLTVVAFGTSLPELATSIVAAARKQGDIITGNAVGSCIFNILCVIGLASLIVPLNRTVELRDADLWMMLALTVLILPMMWSKRRLSRGEGVILLLIYLGYYVYLGVRGGVA